MGKESLDWFLFMYPTGYDMLGERGKWKPNSEPLGISKASTRFTPFTNADRRLLHSLQKERSSISSQTP